MPRIERAERLGRQVVAGQAQGFGDGERGVGHVRFLGEMAILAGRAVVSSLRGAGAERFLTNLRL
jgi:hypothetical protein